MKTQNLVVGIGLLGLAAAWAYRTFFSAGAPSVVQGHPGLQPDQVSDPLTAAAWESFLTHNPVPTPIVTAHPMDVVAAWGAPASVGAPSSLHAAVLDAAQTAAQAAASEAAQIEAERARQAEVDREAAHQAEMARLQAQLAQQQIATAAAAKADAERLDAARLQALIAQQVATSQLASLRAAAAAKYPITLWRFYDELKVLLQPGDPGYNYAHGIDAPDVVVAI